ncbi:MAG: HNH endonuclease [Mycoplasmataceae bacterium]|nr:HNH endonuclease [Mycoplasmataceae bacterium]
MSSNHGAFREHTSGNVDILIDELTGIVYDWKMNFTSLSIDIMTTHSWILTNNRNYTRRQTIFNMLELPPQISRPTLRMNRYILLDQEQLNTFNNWINNYQYDSTMKNIISIIKGNNPRGAASSPQNEEIRFFDENNNLISLLLFIKNFSLEDTKRGIATNLRMQENLDQVWNRLYEANQIYLDLNEWFLEIPNHADRRRLIGILQEINTPGTYAEYRALCRRIEIYLERVGTAMLHIIDEANRERARYVANIHERYPNADAAMSVFGTEPEGAYESAHIVPFSYLRSELIRNRGNVRVYNEIMTKISDPNNFLPLSRNVHGDYDLTRRGVLSCKFFWNIGGTLIIRDNTEIHMNELNVFYSQITGNELQMRIPYLQEYININNL